MEISLGSRWWWWLTKLDVRNQPVQPPAVSGPMRARSFGNYFPHSSASPGIWGLQWLQTTSSRARERRFRRKISDRSWILNTLWGEERREMLGVCDDSQCWCCLDVWPYYGPRAVRETPSCGGRLSGGAPVGGETRELAGWRHGENTAARQSLSTDTILPWQTSRHHTSEGSPSHTLSSAGWPVTVRGDTTPGWFAGGGVLAAAASAASVGGEVPGSRRGVKTGNCGVKKTDL